MGLLFPLLFSKVFLAPVHKDVAFQFHASVFILMVLRGCRTNRLFIMKKLRLLFSALALLLCSTSLLAHDFEVDGIYYFIRPREDLTVGVTFKGNDCSSYSNEYAGSVTMPESVVYNDMTYKVMYINDYTFSSCSNLTSITVTSSVQ